MRKILLAGVATVAMTGVAAASGLEPTLGSASSGVIGSSAPGKSVVRLDGYVFFSAGVASSTVDKGPGVTGQAKADAFGFMSTFRIYPSFDAQTAGGLRYGAFAEVRSNSNAGGVASGSGTGGTRTTNTLYVNRAWGFVGTDQLGQLRFGTVDGVASIMRTGTFENEIADGGWNGWAPGMFRGNAAGAGGVNPYRFSVGGGYEYSTQKITYLSPTWSGFQVGFSFAPGSAPNTAGDGNSVVTGGNTRQAASAAAGDLGRVRNLWEIGARYTGTFGGIGTQLHVGYIGSGAISNVGGPTVNGGLTPRGLSVVTAGATVSYMGFIVGGYMNTGTVNSNFTPLNPGEKSSMVYTIGAGYTNGPWAAGVAYLNASQAGALAVATGNTNKRTDIGWTAGVTYTYVPGARLFVEFVTGTAKERGMNLSNDVLPAGSTKAITSTAVILGNSFRW